VVVGRVREATLLRALVQESLEGRTRIVVLRGDPGIGKTCLLEYTVSVAAGFQVVRMQGHQTERDIPFAALTALLPLVQEVRADLPEVYVAALESALNIGPAVHGGEASVAAAVLAALAALAERSPLLIAGDDVHLMDRSSVEVLGFALRRLRGESIAVVLTARLGSEVPELTEQLLEGVEQVLLPGLDLDSARLLTADRGSLSPAVWEASGGNPLALLEGTAPDSAGFLGEPMQLSSRLLRGYGHKLVGLSDGTREALLVLAVTGGATDVLDGALRERGLSRADLEPAEEANLVVMGAGTATFTHPLVCSAAYQSASPALRRSAHLAMVTAYDSRIAPGVADRRAFHLAAATSGPDVAVADQIADAAKAAMTRLSFVTAAALFEHAAMLTPPGNARAQRLLDAAVAGQAASRLDAVGRLLETAVAETDDVGLRTAAMHLQCRVQMWSGHAGQARDQLLDLADRTEDRFREWSAVMRAQAAVVSIALGEQRAAGPMAQRAVDISAHLGDDAIMGVLVTQAVTLAINGEAAGAREVLERCRPHLSSLDPLSIDQPIVLAALAHTLLGEVAVGLALLEDLVRRCRNAHAVGLLPFQLSWLALVCWLNGRWVDALAHGHAAVQSVRETGWYTELPNCLIVLATVEATLGKTEEALEHLEEAAGRAAGRTGQHLVDAHAARVRGLIELGRGRPAEAAKVLRAAADFARTAHMGDSVLFTWAGNLTEALLRSGERAEALVAYRSVEREVQRTARPCAAAVAARCRGLLAVSVDDARAEFDAALVHHAEAGQPFEEARTLLCYGEVLHRARLRSEARVHLRAALDAFRSLGAAEWERRAENGLRATGMRARSRSPRPTERLTPKEVQVAIAVADGLSNDEAAMDLVVTRRTVEFHLTGIYRKLGIQGSGSRAELARIRREDPDLLTGQDD
jgi:DNA-binding CsgD family transcriptional regulator